MQQHLAQHGICTHRAWASTDLDSLAPGIYLPPGAGRVDLGVWTNKHIMAQCEGMTQKGW